MVNVVHKFVVPMPDRDHLSSIKMPKDAKLLSVGVQGDDIVVWVKTTDLTTFFERRRLLVVNTGTDFVWPVSSEEFIGTTQHPETGVVWHIFDAGVGVA